jgi:hypothetical protein
MKSSISMLFEEDTHRRNQQIQNKETKKKKNQEETVMSMSETDRVRMIDI